MTTKEQVIQAAREAGFDESGADGLIGIQDFLERLYNLAYKAGEKAMQERAAKVADELQAPPHVDDDDMSMWDVTSMECADAIRALEVSK